MHKRSQNHNKIDLLSLAKTRLEHNPISTQYTKALFYPPQLSAHPKQLGVWLNTTAPGDLH